MSRFAHLSARAVLALAALSLLAGARPARAQEVGVKLGAISSSLRFLQPGGSDDHSASRRESAGGVFARFRVACGLALQPEVLYSRKGFTTSHGRMHMDYLEVPLMLHAELVPAGWAVRPFVQAGGTAAWAVSREYVVEGQSLCSGPACIAPQQGVVQPEAPGRFDAGVALGGGVALRAGAGRVVLEARHTRGLHDIESRSNGEVRTVNRADTFTLGYVVPLRLR